MKYVSLEGYPPLTAVKYIIPQRLLPPSYCAVHIPQRDHRPVFCHESCQHLTASPPTGYRPILDAAKSLGVDGGRPAGCCRTGIGGNGGGCPCFDSKVGLSHTTRALPVSLLVWFLVFAMFFMRTTAPGNSDDSSISDGGCACFDSKVGSSHTTRASPVSLLLLWFLFLAM